MKAENYQSLRTAFIQAVRTLGHETLEYIDATDPALSKQIQKTMPNKGRAAFWLVMDTENGNPLTPLLQLAKGDRDGVKARLDNYVPICLRLP